MSESAVNPAAAADAARTAAGITGSLAGSSSAADSPTKAREGGSVSQQNQASDSAKQDWAGKRIPPLDKE